MKNLNVDKILDEEVVPHRSSKSKTGSGAKKACPGNLDGSGAHVYVVVREIVRFMNRDDEYSYLHRECIGCGKRGRRVSNSYEGEVYDERVEGVNVRYW